MRGPDAVHVGLRLRYIEGIKNWIINIASTFLGVRTMIKVKYVSFVEGYGCVDWSQPKKGQVQLHFKYKRQMRDNVSK